MSISIKRKLESTVTKSVEVDLDELIKEIIAEEGEYFLYWEDDEMLNEFSDIAEDWGVSPDDLEKYEKEILEELRKIKSDLSDYNYDHFVEEGASFMENMFFEDFDEVTNFPIDKARMKEAFKDSIRLLYNKHFHEKVE